MVRNQPPYGEDQPHRGEDPRELREQARQAGQQIRQQSENFFDQQKHKTAEQLHHVGGALKAAADKLHQQNDHGLAQYCESMAGQLDQAGDYLDQHSMGTCVNDLQAMARRRPELIIGGALVLGLAVARFVKASQSESKPSSHTPDDEARYESAELRDISQGLEPSPPVTGASPMQPESIQSRPGYPPQRPESSPSSQETA